MSNVTITFNNPSSIIGRIIDDDVGTFVASEWSRYFAKYVPMQTGTLSQNITIEPFQVTYN